MTEAPVPLRGTGQDGVYGRRAWDQLPSWAQERPWASAEERMSVQATQLALASAPEVRLTVQPPNGVQLFRPRFGYRQRVLGIADMVDIDEIYQAPTEDFSGGPAGFQGAARNSWGGQGGV